jgi:hypothetical protein
MLATAEIARDLWVLPLLAILIVAFAFFGAGVRDWAKRRARRPQRSTGGGHTRIQESPVQDDPDAQCERRPDVPGAAR